MSSTYATWEDDDNNRQIQFRVDYAIGNSEVEIVEIVPKQVTFVETCHNMGVHTSKGRTLLAQKLLDAGRIETLKTEIAEQEGLLAIV